MVASHITRGLQSNICRLVLHPLIIVLFVLGIMLSANSSFAQVLTVQNGGGAPSDLTAIGNYFTSNTNSACQVTGVNAGAAANSLLNDAINAADGDVTAADYTIQGFGHGVNPVCDMLLNINSMVTGTLGKALATLAIAALGFAALFGKITWQQGAIVIIGIALLFGAASIIGSIAAPVGFASAGDPISAVLNMFELSMTSEGGRAVAIIGVLILGIGALYGKISWQQAALLCTGIGLLFGALDLVNSIWIPDIPLTTLTTATVAYDPVANSFNNIITVMTGELGISIATAGVMFLGFAAMMGKLSWIRALMLATGIALMFGAADIVYILSAPLSPCSNTNSDPFTDVICSFLVELQGPMGKTIATLAVMIVGILAMLGKVSWELGMVVMVGIALVFGAQSIVDMFQSTMAGVSCQGSTPPTAPNTGNAIADVLCYLVLILYGPAGKALATIAVVMMGFGALMGKVSYSQAFVVGVGIAVTFGAPSIVSLLLPSADQSGCEAFGLAGGTGGFGVLIPNFNNISISDLFGAAAGTGC